MQFAPVAVITGGARGIGWGIAEWFLAAGHRVAVLDINTETLMQAARTINDPARLLAVPCVLALALGWTADGERTPLVR